MFFFLLASSACGRPKSDHFLRSTMSKIWQGTPELVFAALPGGDSYLPRWGGSLSCVKSIPKTKPGVAMIFASGLLGWSAGWRNGTLFSSSGGGGEYLIQQFFRTTTTRCNVISLEKGWGVGIKGRWGRIYDTPLAVTITNHPTTTTTTSLGHVKESCPSQGTWLGLVGSYIPD